MQDEYDTYVMIADVQALTDNFNNPQKVRKNVYRLFQGRDLGTSPNSVYEVQEKVR